MAIDVPITTMELRYVVVIGTAFTIWGAWPLFITGDTLVATHWKKRGKPIG